MECVAETDTAGARTEVFTVLASTSRGKIPVCVVVAAIKKHIMEPHVIWFPWASPRNKIEADVAFFQKFRDQYMMMIHSPKEAWEFHDHICRYGVIRRIGYVAHWFDWDKPAMVFQSRRRDS